MVCVFGDPGIPLIQKRAGLCKPQEGGAWAGFVLTKNSACTWEGLHIELFSPAEWQCLEGVEF